jgi:hypothetical protein
MRLRWLLAGLWGVVVAVPAAAQAPALYQFETPPFILGATTPFLTVAPDSGGPAGFTISFTNLPTPTGVTVSNSSFPGMTGQFLYVPVGGQVMTMIFSHAVSGIDLNFVYNSMGPPSGPARFEIVTSSGIFSSPGAGVPGNGSLSFTTGTPFTAADVRAFDISGNPTQWAIDNLRLSFTPVPEPSTLSLLGLALAGAGFRGWQLWRQRQNGELAEDQISS